MPNFTNITPTIAPVLANIRAAYDLGDLAQLERDATLALRASSLTGDHRGVAIATLFLGLARNDPRLVESAARTFEICHDWYNTTVTLCICSEFELDSARSLALLDRARGYLERAKREFAQRGDFARWGQARDVERAIEAAVTRVVDGVGWVEG